MTSFLLDTRISSLSHSHTCPVVAWPPLLCTVSTYLWGSDVTMFPWLTHIPGFNQASEAVQWLRVKAVAGKGLPEGKRNIVLCYGGCSFKPMIVRHLCPSEAAQWVCAVGRVPVRQMVGEKGPCTVGSPSVLAQGRRPCQEGPNACPYNWSLVFIRMPKIEIKKKKPW